jgi:hypothetical protein
MCILCAEHLYVSAIISAMDSQPAYTVARRHDEPNIAYNSTVYATQQCFNRSTTIAWQGHTSDMHRRVRLDVRTQDAMLLGLLLPARFTQSQQCSAQRSHLYLYSMTHSAQRVEDQ